MKQRGWIIRTKQGCEFGWRCGGVGGMGIHVRDVLSKALQGGGDG